MGIKLGGTEGRDGIKHYLLEAERGPGKTVFAVNSQYRSA